MTRFIGIDPATQTGFVALNENGEPLVELSFRGDGKDQAGGITPQQRVSLENKVFKLLQAGDLIVKEGIANGNMKLITTSKIHGGIESMIARKKLTFDEVAPLAVKKFVEVSERDVPKGLKDAERARAKKALMAVAAFRLFGYKNPSHDIVDAFIIAKICEAVHKVRGGKSLDDYPPHQSEVIESIIDPVGFKEKKKSTGKRKKDKGAKPEAYQGQTTLF